MHKRKALTRFQRLNLRSQSFNRQCPTKAQQQEEIDRHMDEFFARGGVKQVLPDNFSARDVAHMDIRAIHAMFHGTGPGKQGAQTH